MHRWVAVVVAALAVVVLCGVGVFMIGRTVEFGSRGFSVSRCHPDPKTVAALRREPVLQQAPPGMAPGELLEQTACGRPLSPGMLDRKITGTVPLAAVSSFYADLAGRTGWGIASTGDNGVIYEAAKPDDRGCPWRLMVRNVATGAYHVQITYVPRDLPAHCA